MNELIQLRTRNSKTYDLGGRKRRCEISIGDIHYKDSDGHWQDIDANYSEADGEGFTARFTKLPYAVRMGDDGRRRLYPDRNDQSYWVEIGKPFANMGAPVKQGGYWVWDYPNATISLRISSAGIKLNFILKNSGAPTSISFPFAVEGITRDGRTLLHNGEPVIILAKPYAIDAGGTERDLDVSFGGGEVTLSLDTNGLVFPIDVDPTELVVQPGAKDTQLYEYKPDENYGTLDALYLRDEPSLIYRDILEFDLSELPVGATITSATLMLYYHYLASGDPVGKTVWAYKLTRNDWEESKATWNDYILGGTWTTPGGDYVTSSPAGGSTVFPADYDWLSWNVKAIVEDAIANEWSVAEFLVKFEDEDPAGGKSNLSFWSSNYFDDASLRPKLVIDYTPLAAGLENKSANMGSKMVAAGLI